MTEHEQIDAFSDDIERVIQRYRNEFQISYAAVIGILFIKAHDLAQETLEDDAEFEAWWQKFRNHIDMAGETKSDCKLAWKAARKRLGIHKTK